MSAAEDHFDDDELEITLEFGEYDTRITITLASPSGKKISIEKFLMELECYLNQVDEANQERLNSGASVQ